MGKKHQRKSAWDHDPAKVAAAERVLRASKTLPSDPDKLLPLLAEKPSVRLPLRSEANVIASLFSSLNRDDSEPFAIAPDVPTLRRLVAVCRVRSDLLTDQNAPQYASALLALAAHQADWVRPLETWHARSHNTLRQYRSLLRHLIALYDVPTFLDAAWLAGLTPEGVRHQRWYKHIATGGNLRTLDDLPTPLTKKQAHHFLRAPDDFAIPWAFRWAQITDLGGDERLVRSILATRIGTTFEHDAFWLSVIRWFIAHPTLAPRHHGPIIDYLQHQKFTPSAPNSLADHTGQPPLVPAQPHLCMKGRTVESLLRAIGQWHGDLKRANPNAPTTWPPSGFDPLIVDEGVDDERRVYEVVELLTWDDLRAEGAQMHHCVASYAGDCASRRTSIWSLRRTIDSGRVIRLATIEVDNILGRIVQVRRRRNRYPTKEELSLLERWSAVGGPKLAWRFAT